VVEDDLKAAELIRVQLEAEGFTVLHAATAEEALVLAAEAAAVADHARHHAADMDGWEFLARIKSTPGAAAHPGGDHLHRGGPGEGLLAGRRGRHAEADLAPGAVRVARGHRHDPS
jgi:CheY-like chemotaxis protein